MEANSDDYITTYLSYINMLQAAYNLDTKGKYSSFFSFSRLHYHIFRNLFKLSSLKIVFTYQNVIITCSLLNLT